MASWQHLESVSAVMKESKTPILPSTTAPAFWRPPPSPFLKCNVDAAFCNKSQFGATAALIRNEEGKLIAGVAHKVPAVSSCLTAEALAVRQGMLLALSCSSSSSSSIIFESDNLLVVEACRGGSFRVEIDSVIKDIRELKQRFTECAFVWAPRRANQAADLVASLAFANSLPSDWTLSVPEPLRNILALDSKSL